jgi:hypothetical protein
MDAQSWREKKVLNGKEDTKAKDEEEEEEEEDQRKRG